jgi:hypothetical protein
VARVLQLRRPSAGDALIAARESLRALYRPHPETHVGTPATDFALPEVHDGHTMRLSDYRGRVVVLLFGSFGCDLLCGQLAGLERLHARYQDRIQFLFLYGAEGPHPNPALPPPRQDSETLDPAQAHRERIFAGLSHYGVTMPCLDDGAAKVMASYRAWPRRLVVVGRDGCIAYEAVQSLTAGDWDLAAIDQRLAELTVGGRPG